MTSQVLTWRMEGLKELDENLRRLSSDVAAKWVNGGLLAGSKVIATAARGNVPVDTGLLRDSIRVRRGKKTNVDNRRDYYVIAGSRKAGGGGAFYAHMVERGTKPHTIRGAVIGGNYYAVVNHPGAKPSNFLERALRSQTRSAVDTFANYIRAKIERNVKLNPNAETE